MQISRLLMASTVIAGASLALIPAVQAAPTGPCPASINAACDLIITFNADGSVVTSGTGGSSIGGEDAVIGVVNNSGATVSSFAVNGQGSDIFGFDSDGIDFYTGIGPVAGNPDTTTYGGPNGYFTGITTDSAGNEIGTVNFVGGIASGSTDYFSLEEAINISAPPIITPPTPSPVPEPTSLAVLSASLLGLGMMFGRRRSL